MSEACLTLNIIRDSSVNEFSKLPVGVWIHGGGFYMGSGADQRYNMSFIVQNAHKIGKQIERRFLYSRSLLFEKKVNHSSPSLSTIDSPPGGFSVRPR